MMRVLVTGKDSQLGKSIHRITSEIQQNDYFVFANRQELDFSDNRHFEEYFEVNNFDIIINCVAYTAVDIAESESELAYQVNYEAVKKLAQIAYKKNITLIHVSTDYVFDGKSSKAYDEDDETNPINTYGKSKLAGESAIKEIMPVNAIILRTSWMYSEYGNNFVDTMLMLCKKQKKLKIVKDQIGSPTYAGDLAIAILKIIKHKKIQKGNHPTQIYHYSNMGECSKHEFAKNIFILLESKCSVSSIMTNDFPSPAKRPLNTLMSKSKIMKDFDIEIPHWRDSLTTFMALLNKES